MKGPILKKMVKHWTCASLFMFMVVTINGVQAQFQLPVPNGRYAVGTSHLSFKNGRQEFMDSLQKRKRLSYAQVWYPATVKAERKSIYWSQAAVSDAMLSAIFGLPKGTFQGLETMETNAHLEAEVVLGPEPFPVVLFAHGYSFWASQNTQLMEHLASHGFIVFSLSFAYETAYQVHKNKVIPYDFNYPELQKRWAEIFDTEASELYRKRTLENDLQKAWQLEAEFLQKQPQLQKSADQWQKEISAWLDYITRLQKDKSSIFSQRLDLEKIAVAGHSFGGSAAILATYRDPRIKAGINMDGAQYGFSKNDILEKPVMFIYSGSKSVDINSIYYDQARAPYYSISIDNTGHLSFCEMPYFAGFLKGTDLIGTKPQGDVMTIVNSLVYDFLKRHLINKPDPKGILLSDRQKGITINKNNWVGK